MASSMLRRIAGATALGLSAMLVLTGCLAHVDADELPGYTIVLHDRENGFEPRVFGYLDSEGQEHPVTCPAVGMFETRYCESEGGLVYFKYTVHKSRVRIVKIRVDGVERGVQAVDTELPGMRKVWVPSDALPVPTEEP